jgi:prepilin-type N-terminal cleavage/methylation domain-containing protein
MLRILRSKVSALGGGHPLYGKRGYSLIEMLFVIAIIAVTSAITLPRAAGALDQVISHTVFFEFQRQVSDFRAQAFREERSLNLIDSTQAAVDTSAPQPNNVAVRLRSGWTYKLTQPMTIDAGAGCSNADADLMNGARIIMHLQSKGHDCRFIRTI